MVPDVACFEMTTNFFRNVWVRPNIVGLILVVVLKVIGTYTSGLGEGGFNSKRACYKEWMSSIRDYSGTFLNELRTPPQLS